MTDLTASNATESAADPCATPYVDHPQVSATLPSGESVLVDDKLEALLSVLWSQGVNTLYSCQGEDILKRGRRLPAVGDRAYILMRDDAASQRLMETLKGLGYYTDHAITKRVLQDGFFYVRGWREQWRTRKFAFLVEYDNGYKDSGPRVCVRFPHREIESLLTALRDR